MNKIISVTYQDGQVKNLENFKKNEINKDDGVIEKRIKRRAYERQFKQFERDILSCLNEDTIRDYAEDNFGLIDEDDIEEKGIEDFDNYELLEEIKVRNLTYGGNTIVSEQFITRFCKIIEKENAILLDSVLSEFEAKLNI
jgi:hypothetical protein